MFKCKVGEKVAQNCGSPQQEGNFLKVMKGFDASDVRDSGYWIQALSLTMTFISYEGFDASDVRDNPYLIQALSLTTTFKSNESFDASDVRDRGY